ncbi:MAG: hypothetical protein GXY22_06930 [Clostridiaceae bacterium]|jgi:Na+-transporting methylmalonyl-CoA/oxaloacetate decarboxylase gamma subunit|nr:OadG family protein [Eubacteriales bacterium]NLV48373.1 hypothetical protein [Clostridiaceae bacterium]
MSWIEQLQQMDLLAQGGFVALSGLVIVFLVLGLFYATIKLIDRLGRPKDGSG